MMASIFCSAIRTRARSSRLRRSSAVIGVARLRIEVSAWMLGGSGPASSAARRPRCAKSGVTDRPYDAAVIDRNRRRDSIGNSSESETKATADPDATDVELAARIGKGIEFQLRA